MLACVRGGQRMGHLTPAAAIRRSSTATLPGSSRSARTGVRGKRTAPPRSPETKPCVPPGTTAGHSGSAGPDTTPEAGSRQRWPRRFSRTCGVHLLDLKAFGDRISARDPDRQTAEIQIRIALMNRFSARPRSFAWAEFKAERGRHASGPSCATTPWRARNGTRRRQAGGRTKDQGRDPEPLCGPGNAAK